jgi:hypothetical protein
MVLFLIGTVDVGIVVFIFLTGVITGVVTVGATIAGETTVGATIAGETMVLGTITPLEYVNTSLYSIGFGFVLLGTATPST